MISSASSSTMSRRCLLQLGRSAVASSATRRRTFSTISSLSIVFEVTNNSSFYNISTSRRRIQAEAAAAATATTETAPPEDDAAAAPPEEAPPPPIVWMTDRLTKEQILKVDRIFHKILWLDIFESSMLNELCNERLGLVMNKKQRRQLDAQLEALERGTSADGGASEKEAEPEDTGPALVDLKLAGFDKKSKIKVIKEVRSMAGLGLKEAKEMVEGAPVTIQKGLQPEAAEELKAKLEAAGGQVELVPV